MHNLHNKERLNCNFYVEYVKIEGNLLIWDCLKCKNIII